MALNNMAPPTPKNEEVSTVEQTEGREEDELDAYRDQREVAVRISHYVDTLLFIISNQLTTIENLQSQLGTMRLKMQYIAVQILKTNFFSNF